MHTATPLNRIANKGGVQRFQNDAPAAAARVVEVIPLEQRIRATAPIKISQIVSPCRDCGPLNSCSSVAVSVRNLGAPISNSKSL